MCKNQLALCVAFGFLSSQVVASEIYRNDPQRFSVTVPEGMTRLAPAELTAVNVETAERGGTPQLYEAGFASPGVVGQKGPRLPLLLIRYVPGSTSMRTFVDTYKAELTSVATRSATPATQPQAKAPGRPLLIEDFDRHIFANERHRPSPAGDLIKRQTVFFGRDGFVSIDWLSTTPQADALMKPMLASFKFDPGYEYTAPKEMVVATAVPQSNSRRVVAAILVVGFAVLFLGYAMWRFARARSKRPA